MMTPSLANAQGNDALLADLVERLTAQLQAGEPIDVEACARDYPEVASRLRALLPALCVLEDLSRSTQPGDLGGLAKPLDEQPPLGLLGDFRIIREIGRGGMGVVYEAEQLSLKRRVALKILPFASTLDPRQLQRFKNEAVAAATLHHNNIVPVFATGCERGVHFYAMQFIEGQSLAELIAEWRQRIVGHESSDERTTAYVPRQDAKETRTAQRDTTMARSKSSQIPTEHYRHVAELGIQAAEALDYAHQMGIVHRDVKPGNLLVSGGVASGESSSGRAPLTTHHSPTDHSLRLWVTDFGLAQFQTDAKLTMTGDLLGTLRYSSPEQALAQRVVVDHRTDVYSLGVTLYELLTLQPAFDGKDRQEVLRQIAFEEPKGPRQVNRSIPPELETIVLKAMDKVPEDRYGSARELANDLRRFLEDKPILAQKPTIGRRLRKWSRRHEAVVWSGVLLLVVTVLGLTASTFLIWREKNRVQTAQVAESRRRDQVQRALHALSGRVIDDWLAQQQELTDEHKGLLREALDIYQELVAEVGDDEQIRAGSAATYQRIGQIHHSLGQNAEAVASYEQAINRYAELLREFPKSSDLRAALATSHFSLGIVLQEETTRLAEAEAAHREAIALRQQLVAEHPHDAQYRAALANGLNSLGQVLKSTGQWLPAETALRQAIGQQESLVTDFPKVPDYQWNLAASYGSLATVLKSQRRPREIVDYERKALAILEVLVKSFPDRRDYKQHLALVHNNLGTSSFASRQYADAEAAFRNAAGLSEELARTFPQVPQYRYDMAVAENHRALALERLGRGADAETAYRKAIGMHEQLVAGFPDVPDYAVSLGGSLCNYGQRVGARGERTESLDWFKRAIDTLAPVVAKEPRHVTARRFLRSAHGARSYALAKLARHGEAVVDADRALEFDDGETKNWLRLQRAASLIHVGEHPRAVAEADEITSDNDLPGDELYLAAYVYEQAAGKSFDDTRTFEAHAARAVELIRLAAARGHKDVVHTKGLKWLHGRADYQKLLTELEPKEPQPR